MAWSLAGLSGVVVFLTALAGFSKYMYPYDFISYAITNFACVLFAVALLGGAFDVDVLCLALGIFVSFVITEVMWYFEDHVSYGFQNVHLIAGLFPALVSFVVCCMFYSTAIVQ